MLFLAQHPVSGVGALSMVIKMNENSIIFEVYVYVLLHWAERERESL